MIERFNKKNRIDKIELLDFLSHNFDYDFYVTLDNERYYITDSFSLNKLFKNCEIIYVSRTKGEIDGIILVWKSVGNGVVRSYVKINAINPKIATQLLTILGWNVNLHLFVKIRKDSRFLGSYKSKGFKFRGRRGYQILLERRRNNFLIEKVEKESE